MACQCDSSLLVTDWRGQIKSPGFPSYVAGLQCHWIIRASAGSIVELSFTDFAVSTFLFAISYSPLEKLHTEEDLGSLQIW